MIVVLSKKAWVGIVSLGLSIVLNATQELTPKEFITKHGWSVSIYKDGIAMESSDKGSKHAIFHSKESKVEDAIAIAWKRLDQNFDYPLKSIHRNNKEEVLHVYGSTTESSHVVCAYVKPIYYDKWQVALINVTKSAYKKDAKQMPVVRIMDWLTGDYDFSIVEVDDLEGDQKVAIPSWKEFKKHLDCFHC